MHGIQFELMRDLSPNSQQIKRRHSLEVHFNCGQTESLGQAGESAATDTAAFPEAQPMQPVDMLHQLRPRADLLQPSSPFWNSSRAFMPRPLAMTMPGRLFAAPLC